MNNWWKRFGSAALAALLTLQLSGRAFAETEGLPPKEPAEIREPAPDPKESEEEKKSEDEKDKSEDEKEKSEDEKDRSEDEKDRSEDEKDKSEDEKDKSEDEKDKSEDEKDKSEDEKDKSEDEKDKSEDEKDRSEDEKDRSEDEKDKSEDEKDRSEDEKDKSEDEKDRSEDGEKSEDGKEPGAGKRKSSENSKAESDPDPADGYILRSFRAVPPGENDTDPDDGTKAAATAAGSIAPSENGSYVLVNNTGMGAISADGDVTILAAGLNRLSSISCTGNLQIAGTGILLVDSLEGNPELLTLTDIYDQGSVAVFVRCTEKASDGEGNGTEKVYYELINGEIPGVLDEVYEIQGVTLVMPGQTQILLRGTGAERMEDGSVNYYHGPDHNYEYTVYNNVAESVGKLTIADQAALIIQSTARILMENLKSHTTMEEYRFPEINVAGGTLTVDGSVGEGGLVRISGDGALSGAGSITADVISLGSPDVLGDSIPVLDADKLYLKGRGDYDGLEIRDTRIAVEGENTGISNLISSGNSSIVSPGGIELECSSVEGTLSLLVSGNKQENVSVSGNIGGSGTIEFNTGNFALTEKTALNNVQIALQGDGNVYDYANVLPESTLNPLHIRAGDAVRADSNNGRIPIAAGVYAEETDKDWYFAPESVMVNAVRFEGELEISDSFFQAKIGEDGKPVLDLSALGSLAESCRKQADEILKKKAEEAGESNDDCSSVVKVELLRKNGDKLSTSVYRSTELVGDIPAEDVCLVRFLCYAPARFVSPPGVSQQTSTSFTGSGILGGPGAGSVRYGKTYSEPHSDHDSSNGNAGGSDSQNGTENREELRIWTEPVKTEPGVYILRAARGENPLEALDETVTVRMDYTLSPEQEGKPLYVVFRLPDNKLQAYAAQYDAIQKKLVFDTELLGEFVVIAFETRYKEFSPEFYEELAKVEEVGKLF